MRAITVGTMTARAIPAGATVLSRILQTSSFFLFLKQTLEGLQKLTGACVGMQVKGPPRVLTHWDVALKVVVEHSRVPVVRWDVIVGVAVITLA